MSRQAGRAGILLVTVVVGAGFTGVGCGISEPASRPPGGAIGQGGNTAPSDGGAPLTIDGGPSITCVADAGASPTPPVPPGVGIPPQIPSTITQATTPVPPLSGGTLLALADGSTVAASDPERDQVVLVDTASGTVRATVAMQSGDEPGRLAEDAAGRLHVALRRGGAIVAIDPKAGTISGRRAVCSAPRGIAYDKDADQVHVACAGGELVSLPAAGGAAARTLTLDRDLRDVVVGGNKSLLVSTFRKAEVLVVGSDGKIGSRLAPGSGPVPTIMGPVQMRTPSVAWRMVPFDPASGSVLMLHQTGVVDTVDPTAGGYAGLKGCGGIVQPGLSTLAPGQASPPVASGLGSLTLAIDVAVSPDRQKVAFAVAGNSPSQGPSLVEEPTQTAMPPGPMPCGGMSNDVVNPPTGQVVAVAYGPTGVLYAQTREPAGLWRSDTGATTSLASDTRFDTGQFLFHVNAGGGLACASCHPEGGEDGRVWNFACQGARRTQSIRGGISATAPFHWDGAESDFSRLMDDVFSGRMSGPMLSGEQKKALQAWVDTIPAMPVTAGLDASAVARGKALFEDSQLACATCHAGTLLTNNATVDVGTGTSFQVPSLRGVSWRAPFMHTGCAATLADRFGVASCGGGDKHGVTSTLTTAQIGDLTAYLQSL